MEIIYGSSFLRALKKKIEGHKEIKSMMLKQVEIFYQDPFDPRLKTHKLRGRLNDWWSFSIGYDMRIIFTFKGNNQKALFIDIGSHDEVY